MSFPLEKLTVRELAQRFSEDEQFYFEKFSDGMFEFKTETEPFPTTITFFPSPYAELCQPCTITDICAAIDSAKFFSVKISL